MSSRRGVGRRYHRKTKKEIQEIDNLSTWIKPVDDALSVFGKPTKIDFANKNYPSWNIFNSKILWSPTNN